MPLPAESASPASGNDRMKKLQGVFVTGTDTGVGKTRVACRMIRDLRAANVRVGAYKPVCSGADRQPDGQMVWDDLERLAAALQRPGWQERICPQRFLAPLAPPLAARAEGRMIDDSLLISGLEAWSAWSDFVVVEGAGGFLCPLTDTTHFGDLAVTIGFPVVIVARRGLGTINHTLLTIEAVRNRGLTIAGVILNSPNPQDQDHSTPQNRHEIEQRGQVPILGEWPYDLDELSHRESGDCGIDWIKKCLFPFAEATSSPTGQGD